MLNGLLVSKKLICEAKRVEISEDSSFGLETE